MFFRVRPVLTRSVSEGRPRLRFGLVLQPFLSKRARPRRAAKQFPTQEADVKELKGQSGELRLRIGIVPQDPVIFSTTAWENIRFGWPGASDAEIRAAAQAAHADFL